MNNRIAITELKARYFRLLDTKEWASWRELFTDSMVFFMEDTPMPATDQPTTTSADDFVEHVSGLLRTAVTVHHGHMPEIEFIGDRTARGVWAMFDHVDDAVNGFAIKGAGHYHERYEKGDDDTWRIAELRLTRLRVDQVPPVPVPEDLIWPSPWQRS